MNQQEIDTIEKELEQKVDTVFAKYPDVPMSGAWMLLSLLESYTYPMTTSGANALRAVADLIETRLATRAEHGPEKLKPVYEQVQAKIALRDTKPAGSVS